MEQKSKLKILLTLLIVVFATLSILFFLFAFNRNIPGNPMELVSEITGRANNEITATIEKPVSTLDKVYNDDSETAITLTDNTSMPNSENSIANNYTETKNLSANNMPIENNNVIKEAANSNVTIPQNSYEVKKDSNMRTDANGIERQIVTTYQVKTGDTVSGMAYKQWGNAYLWPDLYINNVWKTKDPDLIYPDEVVDILNRLGPNGRFSEKEIAAINNAYIQVYNLYKSQGEKRNNSTWYTLYSAVQVIPNFLEQNASIIDEADITKAHQYINEQKALN